MAVQSEFLQPTVSICFLSTKLCRSYDWKNYQ